MFQTNQLLPNVITDISVMSELKVKPGLRARQHTATCSQHDAIHSRTAVSFKALPRERMDVLS